MADIIYCKTVSKGRQAFYLVSGGERYFLFEQAYRVSNKNRFSQGVTLSEALACKADCSTSVRCTAEKLPVYIRYIEREYGITVLKKTKRSQSKKQIKAYKRCGFDWRKCVEEAA